jgi:DNA integrity scanning protein DisA with diadenylate cyclase activity
LKNKRPLFPEVDIQRMLEMILNNVHFDMDGDQFRLEFDTKKLKMDLELVESIEDQHKRILLTYLMEDWKNIDEVLAMMKIAEIYKSILEHFIEISLLLNPAEEQ